MQLIRKEIVQKEYPKNVYRLTVHNMSGDGEHYGSSIHFFEIESELLRVVELLYSIWSELDERDYYDDEKIEAVMNLKGSQLGFEDPIKEYLKYIGKDKTEDSKYASLEFITISLFDVYGTEYSMELQDDDANPYHLIRHEAGLNRPLI